MLELKNHRFGKLTVINKAESKEGRARWNCICDCGKTKIVPTLYLRNGHTTSCGCNVKIVNPKYGEIQRFVWNDISGGARRRGLSLDITIEYAWGMFLEQNRKCYLSGVPLSFAKRQKEAKFNQTASLDRIDSSKGYEIGNVMWIHKDLQAIKMDLELSELIEWCRKISIKQRLILSDKYNTNYYDNADEFAKQIIQNARNFVCDENFKGINI